MIRSSLAAAPRLFDTLSDAEIVEMTFPAGGLTIPLSTEMAVRYVGSRKLPPGPPNGLSREEDNTYCLTQVAIVRVQPDTHIHMAKQVIRRSMLKSVGIGALCGLITAAWAAWFIGHEHRAHWVAMAAITPPCLVNAIAAQGVDCQLGPQATKVTIGKFFPDGRYQLQAVGDDRNSFTVIRTTDQQTVVFQLDQHQSTQPLGGPKK
jgi:hypothetical protein